MAVKHKHKDRFRVLDEFKEEISFVANGVKHASSGDASTVSLGFSKWFRDLRRESEELCQGLELLRGAQAQARSRGRMQQGPGSSQWPKASP